MSRGRAAAWIVVLFLVLSLSAVAAAAAGAGGPGAVSYVILVSTILAATGVLVGIVATLMGNASSATEQRKLSQRQDAMADDIRLLAQLTQSSLEAAQAQRPLPSVEFFLGDGTSTSTAEWTRKVDLRPVDVAAIVDAEIRSAMSTLPAPKRSVGASPGTLAGVLQTNLVLQLLSNGPITKDDIDDFKRRVDDYADRLRAWLAEFERWRNWDRRAIRPRFRISNSGRVPARDVRVFLRFSEVFAPAGDQPKLETPPARPRLRRHGILDAMSASKFGSGSIAAFRMPVLPPIGRNVRGPFYGDASSPVEFDIKKLLHGVPEETEDPAVLLTDSDGIHIVPWEIHADNMAEPATGELKLQLESTVTRQPPIASLDEVIGCLPRSVLSRME